MEKFEIGFLVQDLKFWGSGFWAGFLGSGFWFLILGLGFWILVFWVSGSGFGVLGLVGSGFGGSGFGVWGSGFWVLEPKKAQGPDLVLGPFKQAFFKRKKLTFGAP